MPGIFDGERIERHGLTKDEKGRRILAGILRKSAVVEYEVCGHGNRLARLGGALQKEAVRVVPNAGALRIIWKSRKKTDF